jgi:DNA repair protein RecN (Recombination protein N)
MSAVLEELHVSGLGVIEDETLEFVGGLNVLTGETGAGKTMIAVALSLSLGARASAELVREGHGAAVVEARFRVEPEPAPAGHPDGAAPEGGITDGDGPDAWVHDGELILARTVRADGRSSGRIGGRMAPVATLAEIGARFVEIHGQHQAEPLLRAATQMAFLDRYAGDEHVAEVRRYRAVHGELRRARTELEVLEGAGRDREREIDLLAYQVREIEAAQLSEGELVTLAEDEARLGNAERLRELGGAAEQALTAEGGGTDALGAAAASLATAAGLDPQAAALASRVAGLLADARDVAVELRTYTEGLWADPERLAAVHERIHAIKSLERKYGDGESGILAYLGEARDRLAVLQGDTDQRERLTEVIAALADDVAASARIVSAGRAEAATPLSEAVGAELQELGMPGARFEVHLEPLPTPGPDGAEAVEFRFSGGPRQPLLPLAKIASGGELSRTMLACRSVLADLDDVPTLVFDEVDAGIGGRAAAAVGQRLARLARSRQVLVVTHLAQIAAHADRHLRVTKSDGATRIQAVSDDDRSAELARMLSGEVSEVSLAHARELMGVGSARSAEAPTAGDPR